MTLPFSFRFLLISFFTGNIIATPVASQGQQATSSYFLLEGESIHNMLRLSNGKLVVLTESGRIFSILISETEALAQLFQFPKDFNTSRNRFLQETADNLVWTNNEKEILSYNLETQEVVHFPIRHNPESIMQHNDTGFLLGYEDGIIGNLEIDRGLYWTLSGHEAKGINIKGAFRDFRKLEFGYYAAATDKGLRLLTKKALIFKVFEIDTVASLSLCPAGDGHVFAGTSGGKLRMFDWKEHNLNFVNETTIGASIACITEDDKHRLWLGTTDGIRMYDPSHHYSKQIELDFTGQIVCNRYAAYFDAKTRHVLIGTTNGLHVIRLDQYDALHDTLRLFGVSMNKFDPDSNRQVTTMLNKDSIQQINLTSKHRNLKLIFQLSNENQGNKYAYRFSPEGSWIDLGSKNELKLNELDHGRHEIEVTGYDSSGKTSFNKLHFIVIVEGSSYWIWKSIALGCFSLMIVYYFVNKKRFQSP